MAPRRSRYACISSVATTKLGLRAQLFQTGAVVVRIATTRPAPNLRSTANGRSVAQPGNDLRGRIAGRLPIRRHRKETLDRYRTEKSGALAVEDAKDRMIRGFQIGSLVQPIDEQLRRAGQR